MDLQITCTRDGVTTYPMHRHNNYEIMLYLQGTGYLRTKNINYPFSPGSIIIVPPHTEHGSTSKDGFKNISISGNFENLFHFKDVVSLSDNSQGEGRMLAEAIYNNRHKIDSYVSKLCSCYIHFILQYINTTDVINMAVSNIMDEIADNFFDCNINIREMLKKSGYAEEYIRACFKILTGKTPVSFLHDIRIRHAVFLIEVYSKTLSLQQISEQCGYTDYVHFSKKFKSITSVSPKEYKKSIELRK